VYEETLTGRPHDTSVQKASVTMKCGCSLTSCPGQNKSLFLLLNQNLELLNYLQSKLCFLVCLSIHYVPLDASSGNRKHEGRWELSLVSKYHKSRLSLNYSSTEEVFPCLYVNWCWYHISGFIPCDNHRILCNIVVLSLLLLQVSWSFK